jgi:hypothetical protein
MRIFLNILLCLFLTGCLGSQRSTAVRGQLDISQIDTVEKPINVSTDKLFKAAVREFRNIDILESDQDSLYIKGVDEGVVIEFTAQTRGDASSSFRIKADTLEGVPRYDIAEKFALLIYKRAKSLWFSFVGAQSED